MIIAIALLWAGCDSRPEWEDFQGGLHLVVEVAPSGDAAIDRENTSRIMDKIAKRLDDFGIKRKIIAHERERFIIVQLPPVKDHRRVTDIIARSAVLEFKLVDDDHNPESALQGNVPVGLEILYQIGMDQSTGRLKKTPILVKQKASLSGDYIKTAEVQIDHQFNSPYLAITFNPEGAEIFERITGDNINRRLAIVLDGRILSAPLIMEKITGGSARITGNFSIEEVKDMAIAMKSTYPVQTRLMAVRDLSADLWLGNREAKGK